MTRNLDRFRYPSFIGIGPPRTATTWMHQVLEGRVALPRRTKETDFFSTNYSLGLDWYLKHFRRYRADLVVGEIAPTYFDFREAPVRIDRHLPLCKVICSLRDPVQRTYSHYRLLRSEGWIVRQSFEQAIESHRKWRLGAGNIIGSSYYATHLKRWFEVLGRERVLVIFHQDMEADPQRYIDDVTRFIGIPRIYLGHSIGGTKINSLERAPLHPHLAARARRLRDLLERRRMYRTIATLGFFFRYCFGRGEVFPGVDPRTERELRDIFRPDIETLEELVQRDLSSWKN